MSVPLAHFPTQSINFAHQLPFGLSPYRWITGHLGNRIRIHRKKQRVTAEPRACQGCLYSRMSGSDYDNIVRFRINEHHRRIYLMHNHFGYVFHFPFVTC